MISEGISNPFELLSALHDDELAGDERARAIRIVRRSPVARTVLADLADVDEALRDWSEGAGLDDLAHALRADRRGPSRLAPEPIPAARRVVLPPAPRVPSVPNDLGRWALAALVVFCCSLWLSGAWRDYADAAQADAALLAAAAGALGAQPVDIATDTGTADAAAARGPCAAHSAWRSQLLAPATVTLDDRAEQEVWEARLADDFGALALYATRTADQALAGELSCARAADGGERCAWTRLGWRYLATAAPSEVGLATRVSLAQRGI